jgi:hypothetical protein
MVKALLFDPKKKATDQINGPGGGNEVAKFDSTGVASVTNPEKFYVDHVGLTEVGVPKLLVALDVGGDAATTFTVPAGKTWRLLTAVMELVTDASVGNRTLRLRTRNSADTAIETFTQATQAASLTVRYQVVFEDRTQGSQRVEPVGTLTIAEPVTAADTITINGEVVTFVAALTGANQILIGASEAATKLAMNAAFVDRDNGGVLHSVTDASFAAMEVSAVDFAGDDMVFTYAGEGNATVDGEAVDTTETLTHVSNVWDAATLGGTTAGVGAGTLEGTSRFPVSGVILTAGEDIIIDEPAISDTGDDVDVFITVIEYDHNPTTYTPQAPAS